MNPYNESVCEDPNTGRQIAYPLARGEVAKITFYEGGAGGFLVRRSGDNALVVIEWELGDGACTDRKGNMVPCAQSEQRVVSFHVPPGVKIHQRILQVDPEGVAHAFGCTDEP